MNKFHYILAIILFTGLGKLFAQFEEEEERQGYRGFEGSFHFGYYFADGEAGQFYNGESEGRLKRTIIDNFFNYNAIYDALGGYDFTIYEYSQSMQYNANTYWGLRGSYFLTDHLGIFGAFNSIELRSVGIWTIEVERFNGGVSEPYLEICNALGEEQRINLDFGMIYQFNPENPFTMFVEAGMNWNYQQVKKNEVQVLHLQYNILYDQMNNVRVPYTASGFGAMAGVGGRYNFSQGYTVDLVLQAYRHDLDLLPHNGAFNDFAILLRFASHGLF